MAERKSKNQKKKESAKQQPKGRLGPDIWGVVFLGVGLLVLISLVSHLVNPADNILGPYVGRRLSSGLVRLLGSIASFVVPLSALYVGVTLFRGAGIAGRMLFFTTLLTGEFCILLAIYDMPAMAQADRIFNPNFIGHLFAYLLHYVFGVHRFGPYFIVVLAFIITVAVGFHINLRLLCGRIWAGIVTAWRWLAVRLRGAMSAIFAPPPEPRTAGVAPACNDSNAAIAESEVERGPRRSKKDARAEIGGKDKAQEEEDEAKRRFEEELAAFRQKRGEPIRIMTEDERAAAEEAQDDSEQDDDASV
ncbi:MAG: hypothetical protein GF344_00540, partial [Chitinivibrionales bacterium]|nr:hypothetical protein [Chitinivibrionales bacterium]